MSDLTFIVKIEAAGEVRDAEGNLISNTEAVGERVMTAAELDEAGIPRPDHPNEEK